jgi:sirohydrochlorin ferrochelatase
MPAEVSVPAGPDGSRLVLVAHGSRDPRAARSTWALTRAVRRRAAIPVDAAFLDFSTPRLADVVAGSAGSSARVVVVPLLLTAAYHGRVDVPAEIARVRATSALDVRLAEVVGPVGGPLLDAEAMDSMVAALVRRLTEAGAWRSRAGRAGARRAGAWRAGAGRADGIVLAAAGSRDPSTLDTVESVADALAAALGVPCRAGYASGTGRGAGAAVAALSAAGACRIAVASYFLAPGQLHDRAVDQALAAGAAIAAAPLGDAPELVDLVLSRSGAVRSGAAAGLAAAALAAAA